MDKIKFKSPTKPTVEPPTEVVVHEKRLGPGYRFAIRAITFMVFGIFMLFVGATLVKLEQSESNTEILSIDSIVEAEIRNQSEEIREEGEALIKKLGRVYDDNGKPHPEWVLFLQHQRHLARGRSNRATITERTSYVWERIKRVW